MAELKNIYPPVINPLKRVGRPLHYTPEELAEKFAEFVKWAEENPIVISKSVTGTNTSPAGASDFDREEVEQKPQYISVKGFLVWLGEAESWWKMLDDGTEGDKFLTLKAYIRAYCEENQTKLASAGVFKENIISRLLGLADKKEVKAEDATIVVVKNEEERDKIKGIGGIGV